MLFHFQPFRYRLLNGHYFKTNLILLFNKVKEYPFCSFICVNKIVFISIGEDICKFTLKDLIEMFRFNVVDKLGSNCCS